MPAVRWPIDPRPGQREVAEELASLLIEGKRVAFSAQTGWGKTMTVIAALIETKFFPVVWLVRSLTVGKRVAEDAALWGLTTFIAGGRERTCLIKESVEDANDYCRYYKYRCPYFRLPHYIPNVSSFVELVERGREEKWCPYFAQDLVQTDVVVQNYFRRMKLYRTPKTLVYDEAHNLLLPRERTYKISKIAERIAVAKQLGASEKLLLALESLMKYMLVRDGPLDASLYLDEDRMEELRKLHVQGLEQGLSLRPLLDITSFAYIEGERVVVYAPPTLPPHRPAVFVSATLPPGSEALLSTDAIVKVPWQTKPPCRIVTSVTTRYEEFDGRMALYYKKLIIKIGKEHRRVLVFAPSERVARELRGIATFEECEPPPNWEGVLLLRARGRYAEGVNLPADAVVIAGAPYLPPSVGEWIARQLKRAGVADPVKAALDIPMLITTLQSVGRAWRDPKKPPHVVLADYRFEKYSNILAEYFTLE
ncbi:MAG: helicase C-terminal domain-containing protein [Thermofilaceae archaeon]